MKTDERVEVLEWQFRALAARVERLEQPVAAAAVAASPSEASRPATDFRPAREARAPAAAAADPVRVDWPLRRLRRQTAEPNAAPPFAWAGFEDLLGGRVLAWVGGFSVLMGVALLFALAVAQGWIGEGSRTLLAAGGSLALLGAGVFLHEQRGRTDAARAAVATAVAALFATVTVAAQLYELLPAPAAFMLAALIGTTGTWLALRWDARGIAALGTLGTVGAPLLVGAPPDLGTLALLFAAVAAAAGLLLYRRWTWLAVAVVVLGTAQWVPGVLATDDVAAALIVLVAFGVLGSLTAVAFELRDPEADLRLPAAALLTFQALVVATTGWLTFGLGLGSPQLADGWVAVVAGAHLALGLAGIRGSRGSRDLALLSIAIGVLLGDLAFGLLASGPVLALGWAASAALFARLMGRGRGDLRGHGLAQAGLGGHVALSLGHALLGEAPPAALLGGAFDLGPALMALAGLAASCFASARFAAERDPRWRVPLDVLGLAVVAYSAALALDGLALVGAWTVEAVVLARLAERVRVAGQAGIVHLAAAAAHVLLFEAPLRALADGRVEPGSALLALAVVSAGCLASGRVARAQHPYRAGALDLAAAALVAHGAALALDGPLLVAALAALAVGLAWLARGGRRHLEGAAVAAFGAATLHVMAFEAPPQALYYGLESAGAGAMALLALTGAAMVGGRLLPERALAWSATAAVAGLFLVSTLLVSGFQPGEAEPAVVGLGIREQGQALLSALWALAGVAAVLLGLRRDSRPARLAGLGLLLVTVAKVFVYDLAALTSFYRVASVVALGLLLLVGAYAWQRARPRAPDDLRRVPAALR